MDLDIGVIEVVLAGATWDAPPSVGASLEYLACWGAIRSIYQLPSYIKIADLF